MKERRQKICRLSFFFLLSQSSYLRIFIMKQIQNFLLRSVCTIVAGAMLLRYSDQALSWFTIACGTLFFVSGLIACASYFAARSQKQQEVFYDMEGNPLKEKGPMFPLVGVGSLVLGAILVFMRESFQHWGTYVLAALLVLGAINQYLTLARAKKYCTIASFYWVVATLILLIALLLLANPDLLGEWKLKVVAWTMIVYGVVEAVIGINSYRARRRLEREIREQQAMQQAMGAAQVEDAEAEEVEGTLAEEPSPQAEEKIEDAVIVEDAPPAAAAESVEETIRFDE